MLIEFEVGNYLSFKKPVRLNMLAANPIKEFYEENTFEVGRYRLLKSAAIYGANASGKSNLLASMSFMQWFVLNSSKEMQVEEEIRVTPFKLDVATEDKPSFFQVCFLHGAFRYRYGFEVDRKAVCKEWLFRAENVKEDALFLRVGDGIEVTRDFPEGKGLEKKTRNNALFLSVVAQFNGEIAGSVLKWFNGFRALQGLRDEQYERFSTQMLQDDIMRPLLVEFIRRADVGIEDVIVTELPSSAEDELKGMPEDIQRRRPKRYRMATVHRKYRGAAEEGFANLDFSTEESEGTKKFFQIAGPVLDCLRNGYVMTVDALDAKLHPLLTSAVVRMFNSREANPKNAQLIFGTHDTNLLHHGKFRRDQIWFTEKTRQSATSLYSLAEFKLPEGTKVRNDAAFAKNYIRGRYGAIPYIGDFGALLKETGDGTSRQTE